MSDIGTAQGARRLAAGADAPWRSSAWSPHHALPVHRTPLRYFAERLRRRQPFSFARLDTGFGAPDGNAAARLADDLEARLGQLRATDPDAFVGADAAPSQDPAEIAALGARLERALPPGCVAQDGALFRRATLDGSIRALHSSLRHCHVVAVGPARLAELGERLRLASFRLEAVALRDAMASRNALRATLEGGHGAFAGEPVVYLFHAGLVAAEWVLSLHGRLRNAFLLDLGSTLDACVPERVLGSAWGAIHWQAIARHLGLQWSGGERTLSTWSALPPHPGAAPGRVRPTHPAPAIERRRFDASAGRFADETHWQRLQEGDLERCLAEAVASANDG